MFKVIIFEDGHAILSANEGISRSEAEVLRETFEQWRDTERGVLVISQAEVVGGLKTIELDLPEE